MVRVKALREHQNMYGDKPTKAKGAEYEVPDSMARTLSAAGLVEVVTEKSAKGGKADGAEG